MGTIIGNFFRNCVSAGSFYAHLLTPPALRPLSRPLLTLTLAPVLSAVVAFHDIRHAWAGRRILRAHPQMGAREQSLREVFGALALRGYPGLEPEIEMTLQDAALYIVHEKTGAARRVDVNLFGRATAPDREKCAGRLLGRMAYYAAVDGRDAHERAVIAVRRPHDMAAHFYQAQEIFSPEQDHAQENVVARAVYRDHPDACAPLRHYVIGHVDERTAQYLADLGL